MKKIIIILAVFVFLGCNLGYDYDPWYQGSVTIESESVFSINGDIFLRTIQYIPATIYNPNNHEITINCNGTDYTIPSHDSLTIRSKP